MEEHKINILSNSFDRKFFEQKDDLEDEYTDNYVFIY